jgi:predicted metal-dependent TIM-barrel fold hydrolase
MKATKKDIKRLQEKYFELIRGHKHSIKHKISIDIYSQWKEDNHSESTIFLNREEVDGLGAIGADLADVIEEALCAQAKMQASHNKEILEFIGKTEKYDNHDEIWEILWENQCKAGL